VPLLLDTATGRVWAADADKVKTGDLMSWSRLDRGDIPDTAKPWTAPSWADPLDPPRQ
jgi:hypothetical protein